MCDRVAILVEGLVARQGTLTELTEHTVEYRITFSCDVAPIRDKLRAVGASLDGGVIVLSGQDIVRLNAAIDLLRSHDLAIESVEPKRFSLEEVLVEVMGDQGSVPSASAPARVVRH